MYKYACITYYTKVRQGTIQLVLTLQQSKAQTNKIVEITVIS